MGMPVKQGGSHFETPLGTWLTPVSPEARAEQALRWGIAQIEGTAEDYVNDGSLKGRMGFFYKQTRLLTAEQKDRMGCEGYDALVFFSDRNEVSTNGGHAIPRAALLKAVTTGTADVPPPTGASSWVNLTLKAGRRKVPIRIRARRAFCGCLLARIFPRLLVYLISVAGWLRTWRYHNNNY